MFQNEKKKSLIFKVLPIILIIFYILSFFSISNSEKKTQVYQFLLSLNQSLSIPLIYSDYRNIYSFIHNLKNIKINQNFEKINIILNKENYNSLTNEVNKIKKTAIKGVLLIRGDSKKFKAKINYKNLSIPATVELKGLHISHIKYDNAWSLEIKLKKGYTINGFKNFSIQNFNERQFPYNAILSDIYEAEKIKTKSYLPLKVSVNGLNWGVMYAEEEFSDVFFERRKIKNPLVFAIGDKRKFENTYQRLKNKNIAFKDDEIYDYVNKDLINFYQIKTSGKNQKKEFKINKNLENELKKNVYQIINLDTKFLSNEKYDLLEKDFIKLYSLSIIFCENHASADFNLNYFINHYNNKIELIPGDFSFNNYPNYKPYKFKIYNNYQNVVCDLDNLFESFDYKFMNLIKNEKNIKKIVSFIDLNYERLINLYNKKLLEVLETYRLDYNFFKIKKIQDFDEKVSEKLNKLNKTKLVNEKFNNSNEIDFFDEDKKNKIDYFYNDKKLFIVNLTKSNIELGSIDTSSDKIYKLDHDLKSSKLNNLSMYNLKLNDQIEEKNFLLNFKFSGKNYSKKINFAGTKLTKIEKYLNLENKNFTFKRKKIFITDSIIIPYGFNLVINEGSELMFAENAYILLLGGNVNFKGTKENPINLEGRDDQSYWKGIYVIQKENDFSNLKYVNFKNLNFHESNFKLTGGINFYRGKVNFENIKIENCISEDCLNIIESNTDLKNIKIKNAISDAIDFDFSKGSMENLSLIEIGGDALDFSGSNFLVQNVQISNVKDKGISNGESSSLKVNSLNVSNSKIGIANKDGSYLSGENIVSFSNTIDIAAYQKKSFYKKSKLEIFNFEGNAENYIEEDHLVKIDNKIIQKQLKISKKKILND